MFPKKLMKGAQLLMSRVLSLGKKWLPARVSFALADVKCHCSHSLCGFVFLQV